jgi:hypothetical protein
LELLPAPPQLIADPPSAIMRATDRTPITFRLRNVPLRHSPKMARLPESITANWLPHDFVGSGPRGTNPAGANRAALGPLVVIFRVDVAPPPLTETAAGFNAQVEFAGAPVQERFTVPLKPFWLAMLTE